MKLLLVLTITAFSYGEKLDRIYLPPNAQTSGGSDAILQTPTSGSIIVSDPADIQKQIAVTILPDDVTPRPVVTKLITDDDPIQGTIVKSIDSSSHPINEVLIGSRGNIFVQNANPVEYKEVSYPGPYYQVIEQRQERPQAVLERNAAILRLDYKNDGDSYAYAYETENGIYGEENGVATNGVVAQGGYSYIGDDGHQYSIRYTADENGFQPQGDHLPTPPPIPEEILKSLEQNARDEAAGIYDDGSYDERKYGGGDNRQELGIINVIDSRFNVPTVSQVVSDQDTVVINNPALLSGLTSGYRSPGYRNPLLLVGQKNLAPVVNTLVQEVTPRTVTKSYLPPLNKVLEDRTSKDGSLVFGSKSRQPIYSTKSGYQY